jgi:hypothetical protein
MPKALSIQIYVPQDKIVNAFYNRIALARFLKVFKEKKPIMLSQDCWLHRDNIPLCDLPCLPDLAPADCSLFPKVRSELVSMSLTQNIFKSSWEGAIKTAAFKRWTEQCK